jgi:hypothetical protein
MLWIGRPPLPISTTKNSAARTLIRRLCGNIIVELSVVSDTNPGIAELSKHDLLFEIPGSLCVGLARSGFFPRGLVAWGPWRSPRGDTLRQKNAEGPDEFHFVYFKEVAHWPEPQGHRPRTSCRLMPVIHPFRLSPTPARISTGEKPMLSGLPSLCPDIIFGKDRSAQNKN